VVCDESNPAMGLTNLEETSTSRLDVGHPLSGLPFGRMGL